MQAAYEYYPFGMAMQTFTNRDYRYGFNGKEKDLEGVGGGGTTYDYGFRLYNPQLAKFLSIDPLFRGFPHYTPYQFAGNKVIQSIDLDGLEEFKMSVVRQEADFIPESELRQNVYIRLMDATKELSVHVHGVKGMDPEYPIDNFYFKEIDEKMKLGTKVEGGFLYVDPQVFPSIHDTPYQGVTKNKDGWIKIDESFSVVLFLTKKPVEMPKPKTLIMPYKMEQKFPCPANNPEQKQKYKTVEGYKSIIEEKDDGIVLSMIDEAFARLGDKDGTVKITVENTIALEAVNQILTDGGYDLTKVDVQVTDSEYPVEEITIEGEEEFPVPD